MTPDLFTVPNIEPNLDLIRVPGFFNTTRETGETLATYRAKAAKQDAEVLDVIDRLGGSAAPSTVWIAMGKRCPITSCRRAMTNLTKDGKLTKTDKRHAGEYGRAEWVWAIPTQCDTR